MSAEAVEAAAQEDGLGALCVDAVLAGRAASAGMFLAGLIANAQLATVGSPDRLPQDLEPDVDPKVVQRIFQRGVAVGLHAGRRSASPALYRDEMDRLSAALMEAGYRAMGRSVARSRALVAPELTHPVDGEQGPDRPTPV